MNNVNNQSKLKKITSNISASDIQKIQGSILNNTTKNCNYIQLKKIVYEKPEDKAKEMKHIFEEPEEYLKTNENVIVGICILN